MIRELLATVGQIRSEAQELRRKARREPDAARRKQLFADAAAEFEKAITSLNRGLRALRRQQQDRHGADECSLLEALSQTYGSLGGTARDAENLEEAIRLYDQGNVYEEERRRHCASSDTYNLLQRLIVRLLADQKLVQDARFLADLDEVRREIERQIANGRNDSWGLADLAVTQFLCGGDADAVIAALQHGRAEASFYESTYNAVKALIDEGLGRGGPLGERLESFKRLLQRKGGLS